MIDAVPLIIVLLILIAIGVMFWKLFKGGDEDVRDN